MTDKQILNKTAKKKKNIFFTPWLFVPLILMVVLVFVAMLYSSGRSYMVKEQQVSKIDEEYVPEYNGLSDKSDILVMYDSTRTESSKRYYESVTKVLNTIRLDYQACDVSTDKPRPEKEQLVLFCVQDFDNFSADDFDSFVKWMKTGNIVFLCTPDFTSGFSAIYPYMGINHIDEEEIVIDDIYFNDDILPGLKGETLENTNLLDVAPLCQLKKSCKISMTETGHNAPLLWDYKTDTSYVTVNNNSLLDSKNVVNGLLAHIIVKHVGTHAWPILNSMMVFIDDFPAPQPEGFDERLKEQFGYDTQSFFMNVWWPDMKTLADKHGVKYNGVFIETYNKNRIPPFERGYASVLIKYYAAELLNSGGEISMHGYNHESLIPEGFPNKDDYHGWESEENMKIACETVRDYAKELLPDYTFTSYVPPSNYFSEEGLRALNEACPDIHVISSLYYTDETDTAYQEEFSETEDGMINVPRITSGFDMGPFDTLLAFSTLYEDGAFSHFIHPDDVLDDDRGAAAGWQAMSEALDNSLTMVKNGYPMLRGMTATSCGGVVQRAQRAKVTTEEKQDGDRKYIAVDIENFYDEQWIALYTENEIDSVEGGELYQTGDHDYWICCKSSSVKAVLK